MFVTFLTKAGGNLGTDGSVSFMFKHVGYFLLAPGLSEDEVMEVALEAGADDVITDEEDGSIEVICEPGAFEAVHKALTDKGWEPEVAEITWKSVRKPSLPEMKGKRCKDSSTIWKTSMMSNRYTRLRSLNNPP